MTTYVSGGLPTLAEIATRLDPLGGAAQIANTLSNLHPALDHIQWKEGNLPTGHQVNQTINSLPTATWRAPNQGVVPQKGQTAAYVESCGILEDESVIDEVAYDLQGGMEYRASEDDIKTEGLYQQLESALWYSDLGSNPQQVHGFAPRYPGTSGYTASAYTLAGTNAGSNCRSIWLVAWGDRKVYGVYPKGTEAGLKMIDRGVRRITDPNDSTKSLYALCTTLRWLCGFAIEDYRYVVRFQWDPDDAFMASEDRGLFLNMIKMATTIFRPKGARYYMDRTTSTRLEEQLAASNHDYLKYMDDPMRPGNPRSVFRGLPVEICDNLTTEDAIS